MRYRRALAIALLATPALAAERVSDPAKASVFIRVIGNLEIRVESSWAESMEERGIELGTGSGFVFTPYGHVLTNHHVVSGGSETKRIGARDVEIHLEVDRVEVVLPGPDPDTPALRLPATVAVADAEIDLAVLSVSGSDLPYLGFGDSDAADPGEDVLVYGFPFGRQVEVGKTAIPDILPTVSVSRGAVAAARADDAGTTAFLQTTATVNPGNSGGPMVDPEGFVLGVIRLKLREGDGIGFAVPVNSVKDFLELNGYAGLLPVERLRLGGEETLEGKGLTLRLPQSIEDRSPSRLLAFSEPSETSVRFSSDRVATPWNLSRLAQALLSGEAFGAFQVSGPTKSTVLSGGRVLTGSATGKDGVTGREAKLEYAIFGHGLEKVVVRYLGPIEAVAFNRSVLRESLRSVQVASLLGAKVERRIDPDSLEWQGRTLASPGAPPLVVPARWVEELSAPFPCRGLAPADSALSASAPGDFRVSLRAGFWERSPRPERSARAVGVGPHGTDESPGAVEMARSCSARVGSYGEASYRYGLEYLGAGYAIEGAFRETGEGLLQLEVVAPVEASGFVIDLARAWIEQRAR